MKKIFLISLTALLSATSFAQAPAVGEKAPRFSLRYATKDSVAQTPLDLSTITGTGPIVLAFYPADWSGGCTKEVCTLRDNFDSLSVLQATILAISGDYVYSHQAWAQHHGLPFRLLSDHDHAVARAYGSYNESSGYNRRTVFVIDRSGTIAYADLEYSVRDNADFERLKLALMTIR